MSLRLGFVPIKSNQQKKKSIESSWSGLLSIERVADSKQAAHAI